MNRKATITTMAAVMILALPAGAVWAKDSCRTKHTLGSADAADGTAELRIRDSGRASLDIEVEDLTPLGDYNVCVDGVRRGTLTTFTFGAGLKGVGAIDFDSRRKEVEQGDADAVLDFETIGRSLEIVRGSCANGRVRLSITSLSCRARRR